MTKGFGVPTKKFGIYSKDTEKLQRCLSKCKMIRPDFGNYNRGSYAKVCAGASRQEG